jgi:hypothetical protein
MDEWMGKREIEAAFVRRKEVLPAVLARGPRSSMMMSMTDLEKSPKRFECWSELGS